MIAQAESIISGYFHLLKHGQLNSKYLLSLIQARFGGQGLGVGSGSWFAHPFFLPSQHAGFGWGLERAAVPTLLELCSLLGAEGKVKARVP